ncbi:PIG-L deacetylase family protein [Paenibacillus sp. NPDC057934]|uniref:PIG-L deacetylase family protein n=1 Tax=Paenibacillus sp. NPDC057934 TaxID=3346282 RepID=UPI0036DEFB45
MEKKSILILSPHPDDAAYSLGASLACRNSDRHITVLNVFSKQDYSILNIKHEEALKQILIEEQAVSLCLRYNAMFCDLPEARLRGYKRLREIIGGTKEPWKQSSEHYWIEAVRKEILSALDSNKPSIVLAPLGVKHVDHILLAYVIKQMWSELHARKIRLFFFEDLPYCIDEQAKIEVLNILSQEGFVLKPKNIISDSLNDKVRALKVYHSQSKERDIVKIIEYGKPMGISISERIWLVSRPTDETKSTGKGNIYDDY